MSEEEREPELATLHDGLIEQLTLLADDAELEDSQRELAGAWRAQLEAARRQAEAPLRVAFMARVGVGKSTLIAAATGLRLDVPGGPRKWSVLPVGDGRTTLGETQIVFEDREDILLEVEPIPRRELLTELRLFAKDSWTAARSNRAGAGGQAGEELYALLRAWLAPDADDRRAAIAELALASENADALREALLERLDLDARLQPFEREFASDAEGLTELRQVLRQLMRGELDGAPAPQAVRLHVPAGELGEAVAQLVDTRGIDSEAPELSIRGRPDLRLRIHDPDTLVVVCTSYESAPDVVSRELLEALREEPTPTRAWRLVIVDRREPAEDAREQRERQRERDERVAQCRDQLRRAKIEVADEAVVAIDARTDDIQLGKLIVGLAAEEEQRRQQEWAKTYREAKEATASLEDHELAAQARELDLRLWWIWDTELAKHEPREPDGLEGVAIVIEAGKADHWSHLYAASRRRGQYVKLDLVALGSTCAAMGLMRAPVSAVRAIRAFVERHAATLHPRLREHLSLRLRRMETAIGGATGVLIISWLRILGEYFNSPRADELWAWCEARWGQGPGYVQAVADRFREESRRAKLRLPAELIPTPIEDRLFPRPPLLSLRKVSLQNFRSVEQRAIPITATTTALVGDNGLGKTGWLEATAAALGALLPGMGAGPPPPLHESDVRVVIRQPGGVAERVHQLPMAITVAATLQGRALEWQRVVDSPPTDGELREATPNDEDALQVKAREIAEDIGRELREHGERQLPVLAYYGTQRLWPTDIVAENKREVGSRLDGYRDCLQAASTHAHMLEWMRKYTMVELQRQQQQKQPVTQLRAVEQAVVACVAEAEHFRYDLALEDLVLETKDGELLPFGLLSDGYRNIVAMVADIAWRASRLNPQLGARAPALAEGVVLIDEIDLHLHPKWQRRILGDLRRAFPRLQFVVTTHSPFIVQSLEPGQLVNLDPDTADAPYAGRSPEDITEDVMGVELPQRSERRQREAEVARRYYELLDRMPEANADELAALEAELDELTAPYDDNQAFVVFLERKRALAEAKRG
jgi:predicted ATP-binding protein involved in virulence